MVSLTACSQEFLVIRQVSPRRTWQFGIISPPVRDKSADVRNTGWSGSPVRSGRRSPWGLGTAPDVAGPSPLSVLPVRRSSGAPLPHTVLRPAGPMRPPAGRGHLRLRHDGARPGPSVRQPQPRAPALVPIRLQTPAGRPVDRQKAAAPAMRSRRLQADPAALTADRRVLPKMLRWPEWTRSCPGGRAQPGAADRPGRTGGSDLPPPRCGPAPTHSTPAAAEARQGRARASRNHQRAPQPTRG